MTPLLLHSQISTSIEEHFSSITSLTDRAWENPSMLGFEYSQNLTCVGGTFFNSKSERYGQFQAQTYIHLKNVTLSAQAHYDNGAKHHVRFCENADVYNVYPYLTYDAAGGNQNLERYSFGGDIAIKINDRWNVGAKASYDAGLNSRNVDPRPKSITGDFKIGVGGSYTFMNKYVVGISGHYEKYKQSCDIMFKSEMGESKIYHLTGLGTHYNRFAAQGKTTYYSGNSSGGSLTLLPLFNGLYLNAEINHENINQILEDLNNLPMSKTKNTTYTFQTGYKTNNWGITACADLGRRHGYENIFGDAATGQYPLIGSLGMFLANSNEYSVKGSVKVPVKKVTFYINPSVGYKHYREIYREPRKELSIDNLNTSLDCRAIATIKEKVTIYGSFGYRYIAPLSNTFQNISISTPELQPYLDILTTGYQKATSRIHNFNAALGSDLLICNGKYAIGIIISYQCDKLAGDNSTFSASFKF